MSFKLANPALGSGGKIPLTVEKAIVAGYAELQGALLTVDGTDAYVACGADPISVAAVALTPGGADSGFNIVGRKEVPPLRMQGIWVGNGQTFLARYIGALPAVPNLQYGVVRDVDSLWKVDFTDLVNPVVNHLATPDFSPADAAGAGQDQWVLVSFIDNVVQPIA